ncbi:TPA: 16S rRNA (guanine(527)-N(7))-methyltransferase RsmG [Neisseria meningitidis]|uniref:Ribosomal RNA small subunit methyltransferase G n=1 Tax=Neisseria meningitidis TaxID=487 RepID=A0A378WCD9_NEIME|nr:16S rRNA (guanine(527)-N(7))-methyltransferase RsmG [Neisseria meningitidis]ANX21039.1 16S rRNA (guanine(527)-N(7))-methyltransferase [Neisseria meningitidis]ANX24188.1 16S rRNA (guanine(527)-N(7))-methyltransferase [Neisseria meningitidis]ANX39281.1 16S rRNA (guanine(527)-N(7))-methyltransferase [Neisseria meningitidis]ANX51517.1 16S rRNA (guanine(527)-N(7))-methyltransferase [Neisseria meningitidis]ANX74126.1 16S rRNA (guanine(527)-N(7))-methyltransferase [Neisseria meningitidis]
MERKERLRAGIAAMGLDISETAQDRLLAYVDLLKKWNKTYNLTALRDEEKMIVHHLLDSLTLLPHIEGVQTMLDVGSGGGQPGIPAAVCRPDVQITLLDANTKKTAFLQQAVIELGLDNVRVVSGRVEAVSDVRADVVTSRAFAELADFVSWTVHLLKDGGYWAAMKGVYPQGEIDRLPQDVCVEKVQRLDVPGLDAERHIAILRKR